MIIIIISLTLLHFMDCTSWLLTLFLFNYSPFRFGWNTWKMVYGKCQKKCVILEKKKPLHNMTVYQLPTVENALMLLITCL